MYRKLKKDLIVGGNMSTWIVNDRYKKWGENNRKCYQSFCKATSGSSESKKKNLDWILRHPKLNFLDEHKQKRFIVAESLSHRVEISQYILQHVRKPPFFFSERKFCWLFLQWTKAVLISEKLYYFLKRRVYSWLSVMGTHLGCSVVI